MAFKFIVFSAFIALARAGAIGVAAPALSYSSLVSPVAHAYAAPVAHAYAAPVAHAYAAPVAHAYAAPVAHAYAAPVAHAIAAPVAVNSYSVPNYDFAYGVNDPHTGDVKNQQESRHGDVVQGSYSLIDADGTRRVVEYTADPVNGFNAVVHRQPVGVAVAAAPVAHVAAPAVSVGYSGLGYARGIGYSGALLH